MRVLMIANTLPPQDLSGAGEQIVQLRAGLQARGVEVEVLGRGPDGARGSKWLFPLMVLVPALLRVERARPDVVQLHESDGGLVALGLRLLRQRWPRTLVVALQQVSYVEERQAVRPLRDGARRVLARPVLEELLFRWLRTPAQIVLGRLSARCAHLVLAPSEMTAQEIRRDYRPRAAVRVLPNVTGAELESVPPLGGTMRESAWHPEPYLLFVGRLRIRKGVEVLLHALRQLVDTYPDACPDVRLVVAGDGERFAAIERLTRRLGLADRVVLAGRCAREQVRSWLGAARALVVPSTYEGMPLVILEAMELGIPIVASGVSGIPEVVVDGDTGWVVPAEDVGALTEALRAVWCDGAEAARRGASGCRRLDAAYRPHHAAENWLAAVHEAQDASGAR